MRSKLDVAPGGHMTKPSCVHVADMLSLEWLTTREHVLTVQVCVRLTNGLETDLIGTMPREHYRLLVVDWQRHHRVERVGSCH